MFGKERWVVAEDEIDKILLLLDIGPGAEILDLCCGPGRHSLALARRGFKVTGVDRTSAFIKKAGEQAKEQGLSIEFNQADMRDFRKPKAFDAALSLFTSFGYFEDQAENQQVLVNIYDSLKDGGTLLIDVMGKEVLARIFQERDWIEQDGVFFLQERLVSKDWSWIENRWIIIKGAEKREFEVSHWLYSALELTEMVLNAGFRAVEVFGSLEGTPYDHEARRLVVIAEK
jgi:SAM-dependent methyltransferase